MSLGIAENAVQGAQMRELKQQQLRTQQHMAELKAPNQATEVALQMLQSLDRLVCSAKIEPNAVILRRGAHDESGTCS
jgi:hypothetical protein